MIVVPKYIDKPVFRIDKNMVWRRYVEENTEGVINNEDVEIVNDNDAIMVSQNGSQFIFTSNQDYEIPEECQYAAKLKHKISANKFRRSDFTITDWLKHPAISDSLTPDEIAGSWRGQFRYIAEMPGESGLREPQLAAIHAYLSKRYTLKDRAIIVMPTGTGKTETMLGILIAAQLKKVLVTVPHDALRKQLFEKFKTLGILHDSSVVTKECLYPYVSIVETGMDLHGWQEIVSHSNVIISSMPLLAQTDDDTKNYLSDAITNLFVDEAHHSEACSWSQFLNKFENAKIIQFTATPFRKDGRKLQGEFIYTYSLRSAQKHGYYKKINFKPVYEIDKNKADEEIARKSVEILKGDLSNGYDHILMARCKDKRRAEQVFKYYESYTDLNPIVVYSDKRGLKKSLEEVKNGKHKIIVCVNMLGEGFDLPQLKVAAIHDVRQSLPITLQFIGRFTRTSKLNIGEASFVTNMAYPPMADEIKDLYLKDADWNIIIPGLNDKTTDTEVAFTELVNEFPNMSSSDIPFQSINPALSTIIYRLNTMDWMTEKWKTIYTGKEYDYRYADVNVSEDIMVIILGRLENLDWSNFQGIQNRTWNVILLHKYNASNYKHLYINTSFDVDNFDRLVEALFGSKQTRIDGDVIFRSFHGINRILVQNFGGRKLISGDVSYKSYVGKDVQNGISEAALGKLQQNNIFASGILNGERITHGCSKKGKIWSYRRGNLLSFKKWCRRIGGLIEDNTIPTDELFKHTLEVNSVASCPKSVPVAIDWDDDVYKNIECNQIIRFEGSDQEIYLFDVSIEISPRDWDLNNLPPDIIFELAYESLRSQYCISYNTTQEGDETKYGYDIKKISGPRVSYNTGNIQFDDIVDYFTTEKRSPVFFFADGSMLYANNLVSLRQLTTPFDVNDLIAYDWNGVDLKVESMDWPHKDNSIQYYVWQKIQDKYEFIFDDDGSGEIADLIGVKQDEQNIYVNLYHLKFAHGGVVSKQISNFYEVCGQAHKSLKWKNVDKDIFRRLIERVSKTAKGKNRILKGNLEQMYELSQKTSYTKRVRLELHIVQPGLSKSDAPANILELLGVVKNYSFEVCNAPLSVYCSE